MGSRRGRLNWSNLEVHISDDVIDKQHRFPVPNLLSSTLTSTENNVENKKETNSSSASCAPPAKRSWMPKAGVGDMGAEQFVGNFMLTNAEQNAIDQKYNRPMSRVECSKTPMMSKPIRISSRLPVIKETVLSVRTTNLSIGQHLLNVFVCHVESFSHVYIMFGDDYNRATKLFQDMNTCDELTRPLVIAFEPKETDLVAIYHDNKWFRGRCLNVAGENIDVLCVDSGVIITCQRHNLRRLPDSSIPDAINTKCFELLYKDRYEAVVTRLEMPNHPTIVLYYGDENVNDQLMAILKLI